MARRKKQDDEQENINNINNESDDTFGLPEVEYEPLKRDEPEVVSEPEPVAEPDPEPVNEIVYEETIQETSSTGYTPDFEEEEEEPAPVWPKVLIAILLLAVVGAGVWYFVSYRPEQLAKEEKARQEAVDKAAQEARAERERLAALKLEEAAKRQADSLAALKPAAGSIEALSDRTGRYYVVIASAIDNDLINDHAKKLSKQGVTSYIIPPFGKTKFSRLAVDYKDSYAEAQTTADGLKGGEYGGEIWVVKY